MCVDSQLVMELCFGKLNTWFLKVEHWQDDVSVLVCCSTIKIMLQGYQIYIHLLSVDGRLCGGSLADWIK